MKICMVPVRRGSERLATKNYLKIQNKLTEILLKKGTSISKILNTQNFRIRGLKRAFTLTQ